MVTEIAQFTAQSGKANDLLAGLRRGMEVIRGAEGCQGIALRRCIEDPDAFIYEIQWESLDHHVLLFRNSPLFAEYRAHIAGLFADPVVVRHYETASER